MAEPTRVRSTGGGKSRALERYLAELVRQGHGEDQVTIEDPKDPQVPVQRTTIAALLASVQPVAAETTGAPGAGSG
jgi:hypothetical protein